MHIEPGVVDGARMALAVATAAASAGITAKLAFDTVRQDGAAALLTRSVLATVAVFVFFQVLPHYPVGISEVHLILGSTIFLIFGAGPAAIGLASGLLLQGVFFAPLDLPMYFVNVTTLIVPLGGRQPPGQADHPGEDALRRGALCAGPRPLHGVSGRHRRLGGVLGVLRPGLRRRERAQRLTFGGAYMLVIAIEPLADLAVLAAAKLGAGVLGKPVVAGRVYQAA